MAPRLNVLHSVDTYLRVSENWIYPQVTRVPRASGRVLCDRVANRDAFPIGGQALIVDPPLWEQRSWGFARMLSAARRRIGLQSPHLHRRVRAWEPRVVHAHFGPRGWESIDLKKRLGCPLVTSFYGYDAWRLPTIEPAWTKRLEELFGEGDAFLVEGPAMRDRLAGLGCPKEKIVVQRIGVDPPPSRLDDEHFESGLRILMVGRMVEKKGFPDGLRACALARSRGVDLRVTVIGDAAPGDGAGERIRAELAEIAARPELAGRVDFRGFVPLPGTHAALADHNVFLCPSKHAADGDAEGGSPVILTEAMAAGLACIGTDHCDIPQLVIDGETGYACREGDVEAMAAALQEIARDPDRATAISRSGRRHVETGFTLAAQMDGIARTYARLASRN